MGNENVFLLHALLLGIFITFVYDLLRIFRRVVPHAAFFVSLEDIAFWIYCGAEVFLLMYHESDGSLRWFAVIGAMAGMFLYKKLISGLFVKYVSLALGKILEVLGKMLKILGKPFGFAGRKAGKAVHKAVGGAHRMLHRIKRAVKNRLTIFLKLFKIKLKHKKRERKNHGKEKDCLS